MFFPFSYILSSAENLLYVGIGNWSSLFSKKGCLACYYPICRSLSYFHQYKVQVFNSDENERCCTPTNVNVQRAYCNDLWFMNYEGGCATHFRWRANLFVSDIQSGFCCRRANQHYVMHVVRYGAASLADIKTFRWQRRGWVEGGSPIVSFVIHICSKRAYLG